MANNRETSQLHFSDQFKFPKPDDCEIKDSRSFCGPEIVDNVGVRIKGLGRINVVVDRPLLMAYLVQLSGILGSRTIKPRDIGKKLYLRNADVTETTSLQMLQWLNESVISFGSLPRAEATAAHFCQHVKGSDYNETLSVLKKLSRIQNAEGFCIPFRPPVPLFVYFNLSTLKWGYNGQEVLIDDSKLWQHEFFHLLDNLRKRPFPAKLERTKIQDYMNLEATWQDKINYFMNFIEHTVSERKSQKAESDSHYNLPPGTIRFVSSSFDFLSSAVF
ncbi:hypothetical protein HY085_00590 [Candidatus Gottesmanbacteria bacterium]|nr:hypothetical protein [Candidatus Gottesmanbacteria bacterium]